MEKGGDTPNFDAPQSHPPEPDSATFPTDAHPAPHTDYAHPSARGHASLATPPSDRTSLE